jgi:hypothetical protein
MSSEAVLICNRCLMKPANGEACCSAHGKPLCHRCYRETHFVEVCVPGCAACEREGLATVAGEQIDRSSVHPRSVGHTDADVELVADAIETWLIDQAVDYWPDCSAIARPVLGALVAAGRLLPPDTRAETEWTMRYRLNGGPHKLGEDAGHVLDSLDDAMRHIAVWMAQYPYLTYSDVSYLRRQTWVGPWVPVSPPTDEGRCVCSANYPGPSKHSDACRAPAVPEEGEDRAPQDPR